MCGGGGGSAPAPDYTQQKADFASSEGASRQQKADAYNQSVDKFNTDMGNYLNLAKQSRDSYSSFGLKDYNKLDEIEGNFSKVASYLQGMNFNEAKPTFESVVQSPYGAVSVATPTLKSVDYSQRDQFLNDLNSMKSTFNNIRSQYRTEEDKLRQAGSTLTGGLSGLQSGLSRATIADLNSLNDYQRQLDQFRTQAGSFYSPIAEFTNIDDQIMTNANSAFGSIEARLSDLFNQRKAEEQRIRDYEAGILAQSDRFDNDISGLTIADEARLNSLQRDIDNYQRTAGRFSSLLPFDLSQELGDVQGIEDRLGALRAEREAELNRVNSARTNYTRLAQDLSRAARTASIYDQGTLDDLAAQAENLRGELSGFSSALPFDFGSALSQIAAAEQAAQAVAARRNTALDRLQGQYDQAITGVGDIAAYDEAALNDRLYRVNSLGTQLSRFTGGRADEMNDTFMQGVEQIDGRIRELGVRRNQLEKQAQQLLATVRNASYTGIDQATAGITDAEKLKAEIDLYNAQQAIDEISSIMERLNSEKSRLERDATAVADRQSVEQNEILRAIQGLGGDPAIVGQNMTAQEYLALLQRRKQEEEAAQTAQTLSSFANALGLAA